MDKNTREMMETKLAESIVENLEDFSKEEMMELFIGGVTGLSELSDQELEERYIETL